MRYSEAEPLTLEVHAHLSARKAYTLAKNSDAPRAVRVELMSALRNTKAQAETAVVIYKDAKINAERQAIADRKEEEAWVAGAAKREKLRAEREAERIKRETERIAEQAAIEAEREAERIKREEFALAHPLMKSGKFKAALFTDTPCRANCWHAEGDVCACSCGGKNHGIGHAPTE